MSERSERIIDTGIGEAPCAEPLIGVLFTDRGKSLETSLGTHQ